MTTNDTKKVIPEFKPVKKLSPFVTDPFNTRGGKKSGKKAVVVGGSAGVKKSNVKSNLKKGGAGDR
ncbi:MAG: hypothetical protein KGP29_04890 [Proteobacteria bacterium]|nr:hypothetical protein [Pseudomonadota bacterium]